MPSIASLMLAKPNHVTLLRNLNAPPLHCLFFGLLFAKQRGKKDREGKLEHQQIPQSVYLGVMRDGLWQQSGMNQGRVNSRGVGLRRHERETLASSSKRKRGKKGWVG